MSDPIVRRRIIVLMLGAIYESQTETEGRLLRVTAAHETLAKLVEILEERKVFSAPLGFERNRVGRFTDLSSVLSGGNLVPSSDPDTMVFRKHWFPASLKKERERMQVADRAALQDVLACALSLYESRLHHLTTSGVT